MVSGCYAVNEFPASYNTIIPSPLSAKRDNSRQLAGGNARARSSGGIICLYVIIHSGSAIGRGVM